MEAKTNRLLVPPPFQKAAFVSSLREGNIKLRKGSRCSTVTTASSSTSASSSLSKTKNRSTYMGGRTLRSASKGGNGSSLSKSRKDVKANPTTKNATSSDDVSTSASKVVDDIFRAKRRAYVRRKYREHVNYRQGTNNKEIMGKSKESFTNAVLEAAKKEPSVPNNDNINNGFGFEPIRKSQAVLREQPNVNIIAFDNRSIGDASSVSMSRALQPYGENFPIVVKCDVHTNPGVTSKHIFDTSDALLNGFQTVLNGVGDLAIGTIQTFKATEKKCDDCYADCDGGSEYSNSTANTSVSSRSSSFTSYFSGQDNEDAEARDDGFMSRGGTSTLDDLRCGLPGATTVGTTKSFLFPQIAQGCCKADENSELLGRYEDISTVHNRDDDATVTTWASSFLSRPLVQRVVNRGKESTDNNNVVTVDAVQFQKMTTELTTLRNDLQVVKSKLANNDSTRRASGFVLPHIKSVGSASAVLQIPSKSDNESIVEAAFSAVAKRPVQRVVGLRSSSSENDRKNKKESASSSPIPRLVPPRNSDTSRTNTTTKTASSRKAAAPATSNKAAPVTSKVTAAVNNNVSYETKAPSSGTVVKATRTRSAASTVAKSKPIKPLSSRTRSSGGASTTTKSTAAKNVTTKKVQVTRITASTRRAKHTQLIVDTSNKKRNKVISSTPIVNKVAQ